MMLMKVLKVQLCSVGNVMSYACVIADSHQAIGSRKTIKEVVKFGTWNIRTMIDRINQRTQKKHEKDAFMCSWNTLIWIDVNQITIRWIDVGEINSHIQKIIQSGRTKHEKGVGIVMKPVKRERVTVVLLNKTSKDKLITNKCLIIQQFR